MLTNDLSGFAIREENVSLVALLNKASDPESSGFAGIQSCSSEARDFLRQNPGLQAPAKTVASAIRDAFPDAEIAVRLGTDPDDGARTVVFHVKVRGLTRERRGTFYDLVTDEISEDVADSFVFLVDAD